MESMHEIHKAMIENDTDVQRVVYDSFGVSLLDGLDLFDNFSPNYCLVKMSELDKNYKNMHNHLTKMYKQAISIF